MSKHTRAPKVQPNGLLSLPPKYLQHLALATIDELTTRSTKEQIELFIRTHPSLNYKDGIGQAIINECSSKTRTSFMLRMMLDFMEKNKITKPATLKLPKQITGGRQKRKE